MTKPTILQKVLRRPSQRYAGTTSGPTAVSHTQQSRARELYSTKEELLRIAADLNHQHGDNDEGPAGQTAGSHGRIEGADIQAFAPNAPSSLSPPTLVNAVVPIDIPERLFSSEGQASSSVGSTRDTLLEDAGDVFYTPATSPLSANSPASGSPSISRTHTPTHTPRHTPTQTPYHSPSQSANSSTASLGSSIASDIPPSVAPTSEYSTSSYVNMVPLEVSRPKKVQHHRKTTYTDEDWAKDVRWLAVPPGSSTSSKSKGKHAKRHSAPVSIREIASSSTSSLPSASSKSSANTSISITGAYPNSTSLPSKPRLQNRKPKGHVKNKTAPARTMIGMTVLLEVEEDLDTSDLGNPQLTYPSRDDRGMAHKRSQSLSHSPTHVRESGRRGVGRELLGNPSQPSPRLVRKRSSSSPSPSRDVARLSRSSSLRSRVTTASPRPSVSEDHTPASTTSHPMTISSHTTSLTTRSPYTYAPTNTLDALAAHAISSTLDDALPSSGTRGFTGLVLPRAATSPSLLATTGSWRPWRTGKGRSSNGEVGAGMTKNAVDLTRAGLAQTTMASIEVVQGIASGSGFKSDRKSANSRRGLFGTRLFSKEKNKDKGMKNEPTESPLGFTAYRTPPVYVGGGSILVQVWAVGLDGVDARLVGVQAPSTSAPLATPYFTNQTSGREDKEKRKTAPVGYIPGRSFVGRALEVGWDVPENIVKRGEWVVGLLNVSKCGALAEFVVVDYHRVHRIPHPHLPGQATLPFSSLSPTPDHRGNVVDATPGQRNSLVFPSGDGFAGLIKGLTVNELSLIPLAGVPAYRAVRTFAQITHVLAKPQCSDMSRSNSNQNEHKADLDANNTRKNLLDGTQPRVLVIRAHDGAGALTVQMLVRAGWSVWAHVPVPFALPGPPSDPAELGLDEEEEKELERRRGLLQRVEKRLRDWGAEVVFFVPVSYASPSTSFSAAVRAFKESTSSTPSLHHPRSSLSSIPSPRLSPSPFSRSSTSSPLTSPYSHTTPSSQGHLSSASPPSSSTHQHLLPAPYTYTSLPLTPYDTEIGSLVALLSYFAGVRFRFDAILDTVGGREVWEAGRALLCLLVRDSTREGVEAQFTTLVGDSPDRVVPTAGDHFRAGVRSLRIANGKEPSEDQPFFEPMPSERGKKEKKLKIKPRAVNYAWVNIISDVDWEGGDIHDSLGAILRVAAADNVRPAIEPADFLPSILRDKRKKRAIFPGTSMDDGDYAPGKVVPFECTPGVFVPGGALEYGGTVVSRIVG